MVNDQSFSPPFLVEMRGSRTPCPSKPIGLYTTGLVDVLFDASISHRQDILSAGPLVLDNA